MLDLDNEGRVGVDSYFDVPIREGQGHVDVWAHPEKRGEDLGKAAQGAAIHVVRCMVYCECSHNGLPTRRTVIRTAWLRDKADGTRERERK